MIAFFTLRYFYGETNGLDVGKGERYLLVLETSFGSIAMPVDEVLGHEQVRLKPLEGHLSRIRAGKGCAVLRTGEVAIALDAHQIHQSYC